MHITYRIINVGEPESSNYIIEERIFNKGEAVPDYSYFVTTDLEEVMQVAIESPSDTFCIEFSGNAFDPKELFLAI